MLGLFDSGVGGLTVVKELLRRAPDASFVYLGDTARVPYGNKSAETITRYALEDTAFLVANGATAVAVACNTVSSVAMEALRNAFPQVRFFDVVEPAVDAAIKVVAKRRTRQPRVGVIGTRATVQSGIYAKCLTERGPNFGVKDLVVVSQACPLFVPLVEENWMRRPETQRIARTYLSPLRQKQVDALILGCTHYPLLTPVIKASLQKAVTIVDSPKAILDVIEADAPELLEPSPAPRQEFFFTDVTPHVEALASRWLKRPVHGQVAVLS
jgi:glutamate racemase